jgi:hypothetical protein
MGVSVNYTLNTFVGYMQQKGFKKTYYESSFCQMDGLFYGENVSIGIYATAKTHYVYQIIVIFDDYISYDDLRSKLVKKYGLPYDETETSYDKEENDVVKKIAIFSIDRKEDDVVDRECNAIVLMLGQDDRIKLIYGDLKNDMKNETEKDSDL